MMNLRRQHWIPCALLSLGLWLLSASTLQAAEKNPSLSPQTYRALQAAQELLDSGKTAEGFKQLDKLVRDTAKRPYAQAVSLQALAHAHIDQGDYIAAIPFLEGSLKLEALPEEAQQRSRYDLAQLYMATERFRAAVKLLGVWIKQAAVPKAEAYLLLGSAHLQLQQYKQAIEPLRKAIKLSAEPRENWYQSLLGAYYETQDYAHCVELLQAMLRRFPDSPDYWRQLSGIEMLLKHQRQALAVMELAYLNGYLSAERDLIHLAQLYRLRNAPYKAAQLLEQEISKGRVTASAKVWEQIANAWLQAKETERSIHAYEQAIAKGGDNELRLRLAQLYLESQRWPEAQQTLRAILKTKKNQWQAQSWLLLGIASHEADDPEQARAAFSQALKYAKTRAEAEQWLAFMNART